jgi:hypothetical protein
MNYKGRLSKPRKFRPFPGGLLGSQEAAIREWSDREAKEISELLPELFKAHGVDEGDWIGLTVALARAHVPAFSFEKARRGPKTVWEEYDRAELRLAVDDLIERGSASSVLHACQILARKPHWANKLRSRNKQPPAALERQYHKADLRLLRIAKDARAYDQWQSEHPKEVAELQREIANKLSGG